MSRKKITLDFLNVLWMLADTGLAADLTRYSSPEILANGAILENFVVSELLKSYHNNARECLLWYYRDSSSNEIDLDDLTAPWCRTTRLPGTYCFTLKGHKR